MEILPLAKFLMAVFESDNIRSGGGLCARARAMATSSATCGVVVGIVRDVRGVVVGEETTATVKAGLCLCAAAST